MSETEFEVGDPVWAKMKGFPPWPGKIIEPPEAAPKVSKQKKAQHYVYFFGSKNYAWILDENIFPHNDNMVQNANKKKSAVFQTAIEEIVNYSKHSEKKVESSVETYGAGNEIAEPSVAFEGNTFAKKSEKKSVRKVGSKNVVKKIAKKRSVISTKNIADHVSLSKTPKRSCDYSALLANVPPNINYNNEATSSAHHSQAFQSLRPLGIHEYIEKPPTPPPLDVETVTAILLEKKIEPTTKSIGFIGLGMMGQGLVKNLLNSRHKVTIWNRTSEKCESFIRAGAVLAKTPADVIVASDITFSCVADANAVRCVVFGNNGILKGLDMCNASTKGYVEMSTIDPETSESVASEVSLRGARYLEAPMNGSRKEAVHGAVVIIACGDISLFKDCKSCFKAMGIYTHFVGPVVGNGSKMKLVHTMFHSSVYVALAEAMALMQCCSELKQSVLQEIIELGSLNCRGLVEKGNAMVTQNFETNMPMKQVMKDLKLALSLSNSVEQPTPIAAAANESYKHAALLKYSNHDVSAVYQGVRH